jgi:hypothetical protein
VQQTASSSRATLPDFSALVEANGAAVVNIEVTKRASHAPRNSIPTVKLATAERLASSARPRAR